MWRLGVSPQRFPSIKLNEPEKQRGPTIFGPKLFSLEGQKRFFFVALFDVKSETLRDMYLHRKSL